MANSGDMIEACNKAAKWWAENIGTGNKLSVSDEVRRTPTKDERNYFCSTLFDAVVEMFRETDIVCLSANYKPEGLLEDVAKECGVEDVIFPNNAIMCVSYNQVVIYNGKTKSKKILYGKSKDLEQDLYV